MAPIEMARTNPEIKKMKLENLFESLMIFLKKFLGIIKLPRHKRVSYVKGEGGISISNFSLQARATISAAHRGSLT